MEQTQWWLTVGLVLQVVGLFLAIRGVASTKREWFRDSPLPHGRAWVWVRRTVLRQRGKPRTVEVSGSLAVGAALSGFVQTLPARPGADASAAEWGAYLERKVDNLGDLRDHDQRAWTERTERLSSALDAERAERVAAITSLQERQTLAVGGDRSGSGLDMAWWGLTLTLVGTLVAGIAGIGSAT